MYDIISLVEGLNSSDSKYAYGCMKRLEAESKSSDLVYSFFDTFVGMLDNKNSYIRTRGIVLIAANAKWDVGDRLDKAIDKFLEHIEDSKPITARQCIKTLSSVVKYKPQLKNRVLNALHNADLSSYNENMGSLILKDIQKSIKEIEKV